MTERVKGGPLARTAGIWCREPDFWAFLVARTGKPCPNETVAAEIVRDLCGVGSRAELDSVPAAEAHFQVRIRLRYIRWMQGVRV
jgi:hypothetical protein